MRLIDADAFVEKYPEIRSKSMKFNLDMAPTEDAAPVVHAYWTKQGNDIVCTGEFGCYEAMRWLGYIEQDYFDGKLPKYCPHCGAKMDGKEKTGE